ncbi:dynein assembly factor 3, axonemal [Thrips palmi]|uniref:Dynein assembly factor 3, axonemal n=1 Tax=Thrips palmi TaxID=161013 RepID=A0A6P8Z7V1_THRPL|nr:dynein assembly factor 3, axonemal [Thrips palmi]
MSKKTTLQMTVGEETPTCCSQLAELPRGRAKGTCTGAGGRLVVAELPENHATVQVDNRDPCRSRMVLTMDDMSISMEQSSCSRATGARNSSVTTLCVQTAKPPPPPCCRHHPCHHLCHHQCHPHCHPPRTVLETQLVVKNAHDEDSLDVLLVGNMDCRHVLKTLSRLHRHAAALEDDGQGDGQEEGGRPRRRKVRFFVAETVMELVARQLLFILAALEPPDRLGRTEKVRLLLELMGNSLVRPSTALWLRNASSLLVDLVTDPDALRRRLPLVDLSHLRHRDRDRLEEVLAFYQERPQNFRVGYHWDQRLRRHFGTRYDSRAGAYDWDYHMVLHDLPAGDKVCVHEYRHWRETGVAFTWLEAEQSEPNLSLAAGIVREGCHLLHGGYLGDIVASPFIAYAIELEPEDAAEVFRKANDKYVSRSTDAAERHLNRITYELQHGQDYQPTEDPSRGNGGVVLTRVTDESRLDPAAPPEEDDQTLRKVRRSADMKGYAPLPVENAEVVFLSPKFLQAPREGRAS